MATKTDEGVQGTDKTNSSTSSAMEVSNGTKKITSPAAGAPQGDTFNHSQKLQPNYLKPTISSSGLEPRNNVKKQPSKAPVTKRPARATPEKHPSSLKPLPQKAPSTSTTKEKALLRPSSPSVKTASSSKPTSEKATKTVRGVKSQPPTKQWILKRETAPRNNVEESKAPGTATNGTTFDVVDKQLPASDQQEQKEVVDGGVVGIVTTQNEKGEPSQTEAPPAEQINKSMGTLDEDKEEPAMKDVNEVTNNDEKENEQTDEKHVAGESSLLESLGSPASVVTNEDEKEHEENNEDQPIVHVKMVSPLENSEEEIAERSNTEKGEENTGIGEGDGNRGDEMGEASVSKTKPEKVPAKKQGGKEKKEAPAYNDVIEETASKLAEKRKNRVLALAGAFETVISLHESEAQVTKD